MEGAARDPDRVVLRLGVQDIHAHCQRLADRDGEFNRPPEMEHWGGWIATLKDPDGNILQLLQLP